MKRQLIQTLIAASFATMALAAGAQNSTPRELPPGANPQDATQNGTAAATLPSGMYQQPGTNIYQGAQTRMTSDQIREYMEARKTCSSKPVVQQQACNNDVNQKYSSFDAKCQKLSGAALGGCPRGADHGA